MKTANNRTFVERNASSFGFDETSKNVSRRKSQRTADKLR